MHTDTANNINGKEDLKDYSQDELSLRVFNDETLYKMRHNRRILVDTLTELFDFTNEQETQLNEDLDDDFTNIQQEGN